MSEKRLTVLIDSAARKSPTDEWINSVAVGNNSALQYSILESETE